MSYKALLKAKETTMYTNFGSSMMPAASEATGLGFAQDDDHENGEHDMENEDSHSVHSEDQESYHNGEDGVTPERQGSEEANGNPQEGNFSNFSLKRCRFSPRQDIALMKEVFAADDKPYESAGRSAWEAWGKIAHVLNQKQIFGPILTLSALTCKLRFEFLMKNFGGNALKYNPKRGTIEEFQKRDELIAMVSPMVPHADDMHSGRRRRGRPRKQREQYSPAEMEDEPIGESSFVSHTMLDSPYGSKRKPGRPRKIASLGQGNFMDGAALSDYLRPRSKIGSMVEAADTHESPGPIAPGPSQIPVMRFMQQGLSADASMVHMLVEYLKQQHESDLQFRRDDMESRQRERSEERRLERERLEVKKSEIALQQEKWDIEKRERELNLELLNKKLASK